MSSGLSAILAVRLLMVGSSASATWGAPVLLSAGFSAGGVTGTSIGGGAGRDGCGSASAGGGAGGSVATGPGGGLGGPGGGGLGGRGLPGAPGMKEKSSANEDEIHGTCSCRDARVTPTRVRFSVSSAARSGTRISLSSSCTNRLRSPPLSEITEESAAEYITSVPFGAITGASPAEKLRNRRSNGLRLDASIRAILTPAPRLLISPSTFSRLKPSRRTSDSVQICASTGIMKLWRLDWMPKPEKKISATEPGLILPYSLSKARRIPSPVRFSPTSTLKPSRLSSSATSWVSLMGSLRGASASGYFALPITSA